MLFIRSRTGASLLFLAQRPGERLHAACFGKWKQALGKGQLVLLCTYEIVSETASQQTQFQSGSACCETLAQGFVKHSFLSDLLRWMTDI